MVALTGYVVSVVDGISNHITQLSAAEAIIFELAIILIISAAFALIARVLRQPLIPAYVLAGLIVGPIALGFVENSELIHAFSEIGIAFLLFVAGLEISFRKIKEAGLKKIAFIGTLQVATIFFITYFLAGFLNLTTMQAAYIGIILAFGSTMVDIKLLADRGELVTLHGRLVLGILLLQDLVAIIAIVVFTTGGFSTGPLLLAFGKLAAILAIAIILQRYVLNKLFKFAAKSTELLFLSALAVLFLFVILASVAELSIVIGAFIAGVSLANSPFKTELESRISPLRDFFAILFFVALGMQIVFRGVGERLLLLAALLIAAFLIKPLITFILLRVTGYRPKTSFLTSLSLAQLSEFSLIIGALGVAMGVLDVSLFSTVILATIITMAITPYFIDYKEKFYKILRVPLSIFKFLPIKENLEYENNGDKEVLLLGAHRMGAVVLKELLKNKDKLLVIDYNPEIINALIKKKISCIYGDICSPEILNKINTDRLKTVISTVPGYEDNLHLLNKMKRANKNIKVVLTGARISEAKKLYAEGADYVLTPKVIAGEELAEILHHRKPDFKEAKKEHMKRLEEIHKLLY
jgi:Kef-type K+ transport system membrane component KefB